MEHLEAGTPMLIVADPFDTTDHNQDGYGGINRTCR